MKCFNFLKRNNVHLCKHKWVYDLSTNQQVCLKCSQYNPIESAD